MALYTELMCCDPLKMYNVLKKMYDLTIMKGN